MAQVSFHHPRLRPDLIVSVNPDQITWAYGLNTASYPTYGGEVVQILSAYFDDMTIAGTVATVTELELIYAWFTRYMQFATQGRYGPSFDQIPVTFTYHERGWIFDIWPKTLPGFKYGREIVAPTWTVVAAVKEPDVAFKDQLLSAVAFSGMAKGKFDTFGNATADFILSADLNHNPFASPDADPSLKGQKMSDYIDKQVQQLADTFSGFVSDYSNASLRSLPQFKDVSQPPDLGPTSDTNRSSTNTMKKLK